MSATSNRFDAKDTAEKIVLTYDMSLGLGIGELLSGSPTVSVTVADGIDAAPSAILNGAAALDATNKFVLVPVQAGLDRVDYLVKVVINTSNAQKVLALSAILPVRNPA